MFGKTAAPSEREHLIIRRVAEGCKNREIADALGTTEHVVKNYLRLIYDKLGLWNRVEFLGLPNLKAAHIPELIHSLRPVTHPREIAKTHQSRDGACPVSLFCPIPRPLI